MYKICSPKRITHISILLDICVILFVFENLHFIVHIKLIFYINNLLLINQPSMDISARNRIFNRIAFTEKELERQNRAYETLKSERIMNTILRLELEISNLRQQLASGKYDFEDIPDCKSNNKKVVKKQISKVVKDFSAMNAFEKRERGASNKDYEKGEAHIEKASSKLPNFIREKLKKMPNNEGYVFRNVWFMGELPSRSEDIVILDSNDRDCMYITTITSDFEFRYSKKKNENKKLISKTPRIKRN